MKELGKTGDNERLARIEEVLRLMDIDKDGNIELEHALKVWQIVSERKRAANERHKIAILSSAPL